MNSLRCRYFCFPDALHLVGGINAAQPVDVDNKVSF